MNKIDFDHRAWLRKFRAASAARSSFRELCMEIFDDTVAVVRLLPKIRTTHNFRIML
jgi:hypothetical protein